MSISKLISWGHGVGHDWSDLAAAAAVLPSHQNQTRTPHENKIPGQKFMMNTDAKILNKY